jgi:hypothetical protein
LARFCNLELYWHKHDGEAFGKGEIILDVVGDAADLLAAELGRSMDWRDRQVDEYRKLAAGYLPG